MKLEQYISELLSKHSCVIIPDFGAFIVNPKAAHLNKFNYRIAPPGSKVSFNKDVTQNDGLLINHIAATTNTLYTDAEKQVSISVEQINDSLSNNGRYNFDKIGVLISKNGTLLFEPHTDPSLFIEAFGLTPIIATPLKKKEEIKPMVAAAATSKTAATATPVVSLPIEKSVDSKKNTPAPNIKAKTQWKKIAIAAILFPFVFYSAWLLNSTQLFSKSNITYAEFNPFSDRACPEYKTRAKDTTTLTFDTVNTAKPVTSIQLFEKGHRYFNPNKKIKVIEYSNSIAQPESTLVATQKPKSIYKFHIIGGCFKRYRNAEKLASKLRTLGFSSAIIDKNNGLYRVSFQSFHNENEAMAQLQTIKQKHNSSAWLLVKQ